MKATGAGNSTEKSQHEDERSLRGTVFSVAMVGAVIVIMWVGVFWLYMSRV